MGQARIGARTRLLLMTKPVRQPWRIKGSYRDVMMSARPGLRNVI